MCWFQLLTGKQTIPLSPESDSTDNSEAGHSFSCMTFLHLAGGFFGLTLLDWKWEHLHGFV